MSLSSTNDTSDNEYLSKIMLICKYQNEREEHYYYDENGKIVKTLIKTDRALLASKRILLSDTIGKGSYSKVKQAFDLNTNKKIAIKIIDREKAPKDFQEKFLPREIDIWSRINHNSIIKMYDNFLNERKIYMLIEYAHNGDLLNHIQCLGGPVSSAWCKIWMYQLCDAVSYLHQLNIIHRDLKLENLLLDSNNNIKIADFGFSCDISTSQSLSETYCGSKAYAPPEILLGQPYDPKKADVWAIGVILFIFLTGNMPFKEDACNQIILEQHKMLKFCWGKKTNISTQTKQFVKWIFTFEWKKRPSITDIIKNQYLISLSDTSTPTNTSIVNKQQYNLRRRKKITKTYDLNCFSVSK